MALALIFVSLLFVRVARGEEFVAASCGFD
jgi:hypothetical protein